MTGQSLVRYVVEDPDCPGELALDLGTELCETLGWQPGDTIEFVDNKDGTFTLKKAQDHNDNN